MPLPSDLSGAVEEAAAALRALGVEVQDDDERKAREMLQAADGDVERALSMLLG